MEPKTLIASRFWHNVAKGNGKGCWVWTWEVDLSNYYARTQVRGVPEAAHIVAWELEIADLPDGITLLHKCGNKACVRPEHMYAIRGQRPKMRPSVLIEPRPKEEGRCKWGHPLTEENLGSWVRNGKEVRVCRECRRQAAERSYRARREEVNAARRGKSQKKKQCKQGHAYTPENTGYDTAGRQTCLTCKAEREAKKLAGAQAS